MGLIEKTLERLKSEEALVEIWRDALSDDSIIGLVAHLGDELLAITRVTAGGLVDGVSVVFLGDVTRVRWDSPLLASIAALMRAKDVAASIPMMDLSSPERAVESLAQSCGHLALYIERPEGAARFSGELDDVDDECVVLGEFAAASGGMRASILLRADEITRIDAGGQADRDLQYLNRQAYQAE